MEVSLDPDVEKVLDFMRCNVACEKLLMVARSVSQIAELAWQHCQPKPEVLPAITLSEKPPLSVVGMNSGRAEVLAAWDARAAARDG